ncbi:MAG: family 1 glycosylhydrolase [Ktedonobacteraceae bacterium]
MSDFLWGIATAAHQVEGNLLHNDWTHFTTTPAIVERVNALSRLGPGKLTVELQPAEEALLHGELETFLHDLARAKLLGVNAYRLSIEWSRLQPTPDAFDDLAMTEYYLPAIRAMKAAGIEPVITLAHMTLPLWVMTPPVTSKRMLGFLGPKVASRKDAGFQASLRGWENPVTIDKFLVMVQYVIEACKDEGVRYWITFNEPVASMIGIGYLAGIWPPGFSLEGALAKKVYFNVLRAHVRTYDLIKQLEPNASVGIAHAMFYCKPSTGRSPFSPRDVTKQVDYFYNEHFLNSLTSGRVDVSIHYKKARRIYQKSDRFFGIPSAEWKSKLDFIGMNYYRGVYVYPVLPMVWLAPFVGGAFTEDLTGRDEPFGLLNDLGWEIYPEGLYKILKRVHTDYGLPLMVTENGMPEVEDHNRSAYLVAHLEQVQRAQAEGITVLGYFYWSLIDTFEWSYHYIPQSRFGLFTVDRETLNAKGEHSWRRRSTEGALAMRFLAHGGDLSQAAERFGSITDVGDKVTLPTKSPGGLWLGTLDGQEVSLYLTQLTPAGVTSAQMLGMVFDGATRQWITLDELVWDAATKQLSGCHPATQFAPERYYLATLTDDDFVGTATQAGIASTWQAQRCWLEGMWTSTSSLGTLVLSYMGRWESPLPAGGSDSWRGKFFQNDCWQLLDSVTVQDGTITITAHQGKDDPIKLTATIQRDTLQGAEDSTGGAWQATRVADDVLR